MDYSEIFGEIIKNDIMKTEYNLEFENSKLLFDCAGIQISKKENYLDILNNNRIVISYFYSNKLKKLARELYQLYEDKVKKRELSYKEYNEKIFKVRQEIKDELLNKSSKYSVAVNFKEIIYPCDFTDKLNIAVDILEKGKTEKEYKIGNMFLVIINQAFEQLKNYVKNIFFK